MVSLLARKNKEQEIDKVSLADGEKKGAGTNSDEGVMNPVFLQSSSYMVGGRLGRREVEAIEYGAGMCA
jgi:hypothetical protein